MSFRKVHTVLQGKGGVGKTFIASLIAQWLMQQGEPVQCIDTDSVNASLCDITALKASHLSLFKNDSDEIDTNAMDGMVDRFLTEDTNFVVDCGATGFVPLSRYFIQDGIPQMIEENGKRLVIHTVIAGGQELIHTGKGFDTIASQYPQSAEIILWLNEYHGPIGGEDETQFEQTPVYQKHKSRIAGLIRLPQLHQTHRANVADMLAHGLTFAEATDKANTKFFAVARQRLLQVQQPIFEQLAQVM